MSDNDAYSTRREEPSSYRDRSPSPRRERSPVRNRSASPGRRMDVDSRDSGRGRGPPGGGAGDNPGNNLHVSSLAISIDERALEAQFAKYGSIDKVQIMFDPHTQESRGFAFVTMKTAEEADAAIAGLNGTDLGGKTMRVEKARRGRARTPTPGRYFGPPKPEERRAPPSRGGGGYERPYDPRPYDSRYAESYSSSRPAYSSRYDDYDDRRYSSYADDSRGGGRYDDRRDDRYGAPPPRRREYDERPYSQSGSRDYPPPRDSRDSYASRAPRRDDTYAAPAAGYDDRSRGGDRRY